MKSIYYFFIVCLLLSSCARNSSEKIRIIYDTDVGNDIDDVLAMAMLYNYAKIEKVDLMGITISKANEYTVPFVDLLNRYYGYDNLPVGYVNEGKTPGKGRFLQQTLEAQNENKTLFSAEKTITEVPEAYKLQRKLLAGSPDHSVVFVVVGFHTNIARLLESGPDEYSDLNGVELVRKKAKLLSVMAGNFSFPDPEYNVRVDLPASQIMFNKWPVDIIVSDLNIGGRILYPPQSILKDFGDPDLHPLTIAYRNYMDMPYYRQTWDLTSVLQAIEPDEEYFRISPNGKVTITDSGVTLFEPMENGKHSYLMMENEEVPRARMALIRRVTGMDEINPELKKEVSIPPLNVSMFFDGVDHWMMTHKVDYPRYKKQQLIEIAENIMAFQNTDGGWPRNVDLYARVDIDSLKNTLSERQGQSTFDNRNIYPQIEFLSKMYHYTGDELYRSSALKGIDYILHVQNPVSGGWRGIDVDAVTFNDDVMTGILYLLKDILDDKKYYSWISEEKRQEIRKAYQKAVDLILDCQVIVDGVPAAWGQQHDHHTLQPVGARTYELAALCPMESTSILEFLMSIENPDERMKNAITSAVAWLDEVKIEGIRIEEVRIEKGQFEKLLNKEFDRIVVKDSEAPPIWARFYEIATNKPFMCNRDGTKVYSLSEVALERRVGYSWYGNAPAQIIDSLYPEWKQKNGI